MASKNLKVKLLRLDFGVKACFPVAGEASSCFERVTAAAAPCGDIACGKFAG